MADQNKNMLTEEDIRRLIKSPVEARLSVTEKIAKYYNAGGFEEGQVQIVEDIFRALVQDTEVEVRQTLSEAIKNSKDMPADVVKQLADDVHEVSIPVLRFSEILTDADLIGIIESTEDISKQETVSKRDSVSEKVSDALIATGNEKVVDSLLNNEGAEVSDDGYQKIVADFSDKEHLLGTMVQRAKLPVVVMETLAETVSKEIYTQLAEKHKDRIVKLDDAVGQSKEVATMKVMGMQSTEQEYYDFCQLMKKLHIEDELMPISALCVGNFNLFEVCMARITKVPVLNVRTLLSDESNKGLQVLYNRARLPENLYEATEVLVEVLRELGPELTCTGINISKQSSNRILGNLTMRAEEHGPIPNIDYIITLIKHNAARTEKLAQDRDDEDDE